MLLVLNRTHWQLGQTDLNLLCLGLVFQGVSIPWVSRSLRRPGNSHTRERKQVMRQALPYLKGSTCCLLADREFTGKDGFRFLLGQRELTFVIRISCTGCVTLDDGQLCDLAMMMRYGRRGTTCTFYNDLHQVIIAYGHRWSIETAFGLLTSKGFHLEQTRLTQPDRWVLLIGVLALALLWCLLIGLQQHRQKSIPIKKHGRRAVSLFRLGLDRLQQLMCNPEGSVKKQREAVRILLSCT